MGGLCTRPSSTVYYVGNYYYNYSDALQFDVDYSVQGNYVMGNGCYILNVDIYYNGTLDADDYYYGSGDIIG
jgi:hypothetical protein